MNMYDLLVAVGDDKDALREIAWRYYLESNECTTNEVRSKLPKNITRTEDTTEDTTKIIFKRVNGNKRWFLIDSQGNKIAKFYSVPTGELTDRLVSREFIAAVQRYRATVNARCRTKGKPQIY